MAAPEVDTIGKATRLLGLLGESAEGATLSQLARASGYPLSSVHRLLASLRRDGFVTLDEATKHYGLGLGVNAGVGVGPLSADRADRHQRRDEQHAWANAVASRIDATAAAFVSAVLLHSNGRHPSQEHFRNN